jgi:hypothetical protein
MKPFPFRGVSPTNSSTNNLHLPAMSNHLPDGNNTNNSNATASGSKADGTGVSLSPSSSTSSAIQRDPEAVTDTAAVAANSSAKGVSLGKKYLFLIMSICVIFCGLFFAYKTGEHQGRKATRLDFYNTGHIELEAKTLLEYCDKLNFNPLRMVEGPLHSVLSSAGVENCGEDKFGTYRMECILNLFVEGGNHQRLLELAWVKSKDRKTRLLILFLNGGSGSGVCGLPDFRLYNMFNAEESFKRAEEFRWVDSHTDEISPRLDACLKRLKEKRYKERFRFLFYDHAHELHFSKIRDGQGELSFVEYESALKQNSKIKTYPFRN